MSALILFTKEVLRRDIGMYHQSIDAAREVLQVVSSLAPEVNIESLQEKCRYWLTWLDTPQPVLKVVATNSIRTNSHFREALTVLGQSFQSVVLAEKDGQSAADFLLYTTMASAPWREDELELLALHRDDAPACILLLLEADALDEEERADAVDFAGRVLSSRLGATQEKLGVTTSVAEVVNVIQSQQVSAQRRADHILDRLRGLLPQQIELLDARKKDLAQNIAQKQRDYAQWKQQSDHLLRQLLVAENTAEVHVAKIVARVHKELREEIMSLQKKYRRMCQEKEILNIGQDFSDRLMEDLQNVLKKTRQTLSHRLAEWFNEQTISISQMRQKCGLPPCDVDARDWLVVPSTVAPEAARPLPQQLSSPFSRLRDVLTSLVVGGIVGSIVPPLALPATIFTWIGMGWEQKQRELQSYRAQLMHWIDTAFAEVEKSISLYLEDVKYRVSEAAKGAYRALHEETFESIRDHQQKHPLLSDVKSLQTQLDQLQEVLSTLQEQLKRLDDARSVSNMMSGG